MIRQKKQLLLIIGLALLLSFNMNSSAYAATVEASPNAATMTLNGGEVKMDAYNIGGNNYFKLRDLAKIFEGTEKQFEITWDENAKAIDMVLGKEYTADGSELKSTNVFNRTKASLSNAKTLLEGQPVELTAYNIGGNNYFKLRDLGRTLDFSVEYNAKIKQIELDTKKSYVEEEKPVEQEKPPQPTSGDFKKYEDIIKSGKLGGDIPTNPVDFIKTDMDNDGVQEIFALVPNPIPNEKSYVLHFNEAGELVSKAYTYLNGDAHMFIIDDYINPEHMGPDLQDNFNPEREQLIVVDKQDNYTDALGFEFFENAIHEYKFGEISVFYTLKDDFEIEIKAHDLGLEKDITARETFGKDAQRILIEAGTYDEKGNLTIDEENLNEYSGASQGYLISTIIDVQQYKDPQTGYRGTKYIISLKDTTSNRELIQHYYIEIRDTKDFYGSRTKIGF